jgi:hypothetical protein
MRRALAIQCCLALAIAYVLAPFQHVHQGEAHGGDHSHAPLIHAHFGGHHHDHVDKPGDREIENPDEDQASSLDTFTLVLTLDFHPFIPSRAPDVVSPSAETRTSVEIVEERGHGPPAARNSSPRPPPL